VGNRRGELKKWAMAPATAALLALSGGASATAADLETESLDSNISLSSHGDESEGSCKDGECKDGECKDGECKGSDKDKDKDKEESD